MRSFTNQEIAQILREVAAAYEVKGESFFQVRAYDNAADSVEHATSMVKDLWDEGRLQDLPGVGGSIAQHLDELFRTGKVKHFDEVKKGLPEGMFKLLIIPGIGPKSAYKLAKDLQVKSIRDLKKACEKHQVCELEGFGERSEEEILAGIAEIQTESSRMLLPLAYDLAQRIVEKLKDIEGVRRIDPLGSLRRMASTVGDVDLAVATTKPQKVIDVFVKLPQVKKVLGKGEVKARVLLKTGQGVDLYTHDVRGYGALLQHLTGSKHHNIHLRVLAQEKDCSLSEYGIVPLHGRKLSEKELEGSEFPERISESSDLIICDTEEEFYGKLGLDWIPPELREDRGEIEAAQKSELPRLVELSHIKGDLHIHCNFDLEESHDPGLSSIEEIAQKAQELGYEYVAIGNHSPAVSTHDDQQMRDLICKKQKEIDKVQKKFPKLKLLNMIEVDILAEGKLALSDDNLKLLDIAIAGVHSSLRQTEEKMTKRILTALENPYIHALAHPTGRLLNEREGYELHWQKVFDVCVKNKKALEVNSFYDRLDLPDILVKQAVEKGVKLVINTDAHEVKHMDLMFYGAATARRGWAEKKDMLNTRSLKDLLTFFRLP